MGILKVHAHNLNMFVETDVSLVSFFLIHPIWAFFSGLPCEGECSQTAGIAPSSRHQYLIGIVPLSGVV